MNSNLKFVENEILELEKLGKVIGNTPLFKLQSIGLQTNSTVFAKMEWQQFGGSVKSRAAYNIFQQAIKNGDLGQGKRLLDASSGNTAIAYAAIGAKLGIGVTICIPQNASKERLKELYDFGTDLVLTSPLGGTDEAQDEALKIYRGNPELYFYANQYSNAANWLAHYDHTALEIWEQTDGQITHFVCGLGTTGSITGIGRRLKELNPAIKIIALQPDSPLHIMEGWKHLSTCQVPGIYDPFMIDEVLEISSSEAIDRIISIAKNEGFLLSPSSAANLAGANKVARSVSEAIVVTLLPDNGEKYIENIQDWIFK